MSKFKVTAYLPVLAPLPFGEDSNFSDLLINSVEEIKQLSGVLEASYAEDESVPIVIDIMKPEKLPIHLKPLTELPCRERKLVTVLCFSCTTQFREFNMWSAVDHVERKNSSISVSILCDALEHWVTEIVIMALLARPGGLETLPCFTVQDGQILCSSRELQSDLRPVVIDAEKRGWPPLQTLQISDVLSWVQEQGWNINTLGKTPVMRALNAFTYFVGPLNRNMMELLLYSLLGIEALYIKGEGIAEQIAEKTQVFFGPLDGMKKHLKSMYNFRSRFVHGDLDLPSQFKDDSETPAFEKYYSELSDATSLAQAILLATLQRMVKNHWSDIEFVYTLKLS